MNSANVSGDFTLLPTQKTMLLLLARVVKRGGVFPERATLGCNTWFTLATDLAPHEVGSRIKIDTQDRRFLDIAGVSFYQDENVPEGEVIFLHSTEECARGRFDGLLLPPTF